MYHTHKIQEQQDDGSYEAMARGAAHESLSSLRLVAVETTPPTFTFLGRTHSSKAILESQ